MIHQCCSRALQAGVSKVFPFHRCVLEVRGFYSRNKGRAKSTTDKNPRGGGVVSTTLQRKLIFFFLKYRVQKAQRSAATLP